jgi:hypothetical protein
MTKHYFYHFSLNETYKQPSFITQEIPKPCKMISYVASFLPVNQRVPLLQVVAKVDSHEQSRWFFFFKSYSNSWHILKFHHEHFKQSLHDINLIFIRFCRTKATRFLDHLFQWRGLNSSAHAIPKIVMAHPQALDKLTLDDLHETAFLLLVYKMTPCFTDMCQGIKVQSLSSPWPCSFFCVLLLFVTVFEAPHFETKILQYK